MAITNTGRTIEKYIQVVRMNGLQTNKDAHFGGNVTIDGNITNAGVLTNPITSSSATAFGVGPNGATNPAFNIDASTASSATGVNIKSAAATGGVVISAISSGTNEAITLAPKGTGNVTIGNGTGSITISTGTGGNTTISTGRVAISTVNSNGFVVGANGTTNPQFKVDASTASVATGLSITGAAATAGLALGTLSSGTNENLTISAKGTGIVTINSAVVATAGGAAADGVAYGSIGVGIYTGTGAPTFSAMNGSIYTDSNATTTTTRIYVNKSGAGTAGTTWTALTTAA